MGVDILGFMRHKMTAKMVLSFPALVDTWEEEIKQHFVEEIPAHMQKKATWFYGLPTEGDIVKLWEICSDPMEDWPPFIINCFFGDIDVFKNVISVEHSPEHKYANIFSLESGKKIIEINRIIARKMGEIEILYCPDSAFPTSNLLDLAYRGKTLDEMKEHGFRKYGIPPKGIDKGRAFMFFMDYVDDEIGEWSELGWRDCEENWP